MALPNGVTTTTLTLGPYTDAEGDVQYEGLVGFITPSSPVRHLATGAVIVQQPIKVVIGQGGVGSVVLPQTDQAGITPSPFTYTLTWQTGRFDGNPGNLTFALPVAAGSTVDFDTLISTPAGVSVPTGVVSVNGKSGVVTLTAADVGATANVVGAAGSGASNALSANDPTTTNARTPTAHTHPASDLTATGTRDATTFLRGDNTWATPAGGGGGTASLTPTATKTAAYTAAVGDLAVMNVAGGATTLTLPAAPTDKSTVGFIAIGATSAAPLTVNRGGSDTLGPASATSVTAVLANESTVYQYDATNTRWLAVSNVKPQAALDSRYAGQVTDAAVASALGATTATAIAGRTELKAAYVAADKGITVTGFRRAAGRLAPALTVAATPPTVSYPSDTGQTSITGYRTISLNPSTAPVSVYGAAGFTLSGSGYAPTSLSASNGTANSDGTHSNQRAALPLSLEFGFDGAIFEMQVINKGAGNYRIRVDDQYITAVTPVAVASDGLWHLLTVDFTSAGGAKPRKIRVDLYNHELISLRVAQTATVWPSIPRGPRVMALGDSYTGGAGVEGSRGLSTWLAYAADYLGWDDYWNAGIGGTGIVAVNTAAFGGGPKFRDRLATDVFPYNPSVLVIAGGHNDAAGAALQTEAQSLYTAARAGLPNAKIIVVGPYSQGAGNVAFAAIQANIAAAVAACPAGTVDQFIDTVTSPSWLTGTGYAGNLKNDGNSDIYIKSDNVHPTEPGHVYLGYRMAQAIQNGMRG